MLLLQKTMLMAEGLGRNLDDTVNMWTIARPLVEDWMIQNRGPDTRLAEIIGAASATLHRLPRLLAQAEAIGERTLERDGSLLPRRWVAVAALIGLLVGLALG